MNAAAVLYNNRSPLSSADSAPVTDALLSGGIFLDETVFLPCGAPHTLSSLARLFSEHAFLFVICERALFAAAREAIASAAGMEFSDYTLQTPSNLVCLIPSGKEGAETVRGEIVSLVDGRRKNSYSRQVLRTVGVPPELLRAAIAHAEAAAGGSLVLHTETAFGNGRIEVIYDRATPKMTADEVVRILATELDDYLYSMRDEGIEARLVDALKLRRMKISTAESFTGGGVGAAIVSVAGASQVFYEGLNTYDSASKEERLNVSHFTLQTKGAVSDEVAYEMAAGLLARGTCDVAVATTGYAGPETDVQKQGLCYIAVGTKANVRVYRRRIAGNRETVTKTAIQLALFLAYREIKDSFRKSIKEIEL